MIHQNVELHNVAEAVPTGDGGVRLQRVPESVRMHLSDHGRERMLDPAGVEVRFVPEGDRAAVRLHSLSGPIELRVFFGDVQAGPLPCVAEKLTAARVPLPAWLLALDRALLAAGAFSHRVCRVMLTGGHVCFHGVEGAVRPPRPDELPPLRCLGYGTSITQGAGASARHLCFLTQTARRLGADALNLGCASAAFCEPQLADYIGRRDDWHVATLEPTANMLNVPLDEFRRRAAYLVDAVAGADESRPVACITLMRLAGDMRPADPAAGPAPEDYRRAFREVAAACGRPNVHVIEGTDLLADLTDLTTSMVHPSDYGHARVAEGLAPRLRVLLAASPARA